MVKHTVILSDGQPCLVRRLGLYEINKIDPPEVSGPFVYVAITTGDVEHYVEFDLSAWESPPQKPDIPESDVVKKSAAWYDWREYKLYQAALHHEKQRIESVAAYLEREAQYILDNCVEPENVDRIVTKEDWHLVYTAALIPQVTQELIAECLKREFKAAYADKEIFDALTDAESGQGVYDAIMVWENNIMLEMQMTEVEYAMMPLEERVRKICAMNLSKWIQHLESDRVSKEIKAKAKSKGARKL